uniref:Uncharacterized protein n=1 Tax=Rhizophora mucronata TaxID=61149 RepID=A0A2P2PA70_RHIMU
MLSSPTCMDVLKGGMKRPLLQS